MTSTLAALLSMSRRHVDYLFGSLVRLPTFCPFCPGHPLHIFVATSGDARLSELDYWGLFDLRHVVSPPRVQFLVLPLPTILDDTSLSERLAMAMPELGRRFRFFMNERAVYTHCSPEGSVPLFTVFPHGDRGSGHAQRPGPILETVSLLERCFRSRDERAVFQDSAVANQPGSANATAPTAAPLGVVRRPVYPLSVPTHLESHAVSSGPGIGVGNDFVVLAPDVVPVDLALRGPFTQQDLCHSGIEVLSLSRPCTVHVPTLCPSTPHEAPFVALLPAARHRNDRFVLVDASRVVHPPLCRFWVQQVPGSVTPVSIIAAIRRVQPALNVMGLLFPDSRPIRSLTEVGSNVPLLTILPESFAWDSLPSPLQGRRLASRRFALSATPGRHDGIGQPSDASVSGTAVSSSTTTTMAVHTTTGTTTTVTSAMHSTVTSMSGPHRSLDGRPVRFFISSPNGHVEALTLTGDLPIEEVLAQLCWQLAGSDSLFCDTILLACERVLSDIDGGFSIFVASQARLEVEHAWLDADPAFQYPSVIRLPFRLSMASLAELCGAAFSDGLHVATSGTPWDRSPRNLKHSDVVTVRSCRWHLFSLPLPALEARVDGISLLLAQQIGPGVRHPIRRQTEEGDWVPQTLAHDYASLHDFWKCTHLNWPIHLQDEIPFQKCVLVGLDIPPLIVTAGTRWAPQAHDVNLMYATHLSSYFGARRWRDSGLAYGDVCVMFDRRVDSTGRRPWLIAVDTFVDVILGTADGSDLHKWPCPDEWSLRPIHTLGPIGHAAMQLSSAPLPALFHVDPPGGPLIELSSSSSDEAEIVDSVPTESPGEVPPSSAFPEDLWAIPAIDAEIDLADVIERMLQEEAPAPPVDDPGHGFSLLQVSARAGRTATAVCDQPHSECDVTTVCNPECEEAPEPPVSPAQLEVHWVGGCVSHAQVKCDATFAEVACSLRSPKDGRLAAYIIPVYPQTTRHMQCIADVETCPEGAVPALVHHAEADALATYFSTQDPFAMCRSLGLPVGHFLFAGKPWSGVHEWAIPGMRLSHVRAQLITATAATPCRSDALPLPFDDLQLETTPSALPCHTVGSDGFQSTAWMADGNRLQTGLDPHMFESLFDRASLQRLCKDLGRIGRLHPATVEALRSCMIWTGEDFRAVRVYSDGSFHQSTDQSAWAICVLVLVGDRWQFAGFACDVLAAEGCRGHFGNDHNSAHIAELAAMAHVALLVGGLPSVPVEICFDAIAAAGVAEGKYWSASVNHFACTVTTLMHLATRHRTPVHWRHVRAHSGDAMNELVDTAAKAAVAGCPCNAFDVFEVAMLFHSPEVKFLWWPFASTSFPEVQPDGSANVGIAPSSEATQITRCIPAQHCPDTGARWHITFVTYNCLSLRSLVQRQCLAQQFQRCKAHVVGLQETRQDCDQLRYAPDFVVFASQPSQGQDGCQLWISRHLPFATTADGVEVIFDPCTASVFIAEPRLPIVLCEIADVAIAFVVGHAPTSCAPEPTIAEWWSHLGSTIRCIPRRYQPFFLLDANARFSPRSVGTPEDSHCLNVPASYLRQLLVEQQLAISGNLDSCGNPITSWVSPRQSPACLDYVAIPAVFAPGVRVQGAIPGFADCFDFDHRPVLVHLTWHAVAKAPTSRLRFDRKAMLTPQGRERIRQIFEQAPQCSWDSHADVYLDRLNAHLVDALVAEFPAPRCRARQPHINAVAWRHVRLLRKARRQLRSISLSARLYSLRVCFKAWAASPPVLPDRPLAKYRHLSARCAQLVRNARKMLRSEVSKSVAAHTRECFAEARHAGPDGLARLRRGILKTGRSYKPLRLAPSLDISGDTIVGRKQTAEACGVHFAAAERALPADWSSVSRSAADAPVTSLELQDIPTVYELACSFSRLQSQKAPGILQIFPEVYKAAPIAAAEAHWPLLLRMATGREAPTLFKGGLIAAIPKPAKNPRLLTGWRNVLLQEPAAKAFGKSFRSRIVSVFQKLALPAQCGSQRNVPLELPMLHVRMHLEGLATAHSSGGCLFVDAKDAYYSVIRHFLFADGVIDTPTQLEKAIESIHPDEDHRQLLAAALVGPGLLADAGPAVQSYIRSILCGSWTTTHVDAAGLYEATTGTTPGAPLADVLFQIIFTVALKDLQLRLETCEEFSWQGERPLVLSTWADDLAVPLHTSSAEALVPAAVASARHAHSSLSRIGLEVNFSPGKTEALLLWRGPGSREIRRQYLATGSPTVSVPLSGGETADLTLTRSYVHLGGLVRDDANQLEDIQRRRRCAQATYVKLRKRLFFNPHLTRPEKLSLLFSLVHKSFLHGAGFWRLDTKCEADGFRAAISAWYRSSVRPLCGTSARGLTDDTVLDLLGVLSPDEILHIERCRLLIAVSRSNASSLWIGIQKVGRWAACAVRAPAQVFQRESSSFVELVEWVHSHYPHCQLMIRQFRRRCLALRAQRYDSALATARSLHSFHQAGGTSFTARPCSMDALHMCTICGLQCGSKASLASHRSRVHGEPGRASTFFGTACLVCGSEFWTTPRLRMHLRKSPACLATVTGSDVDYHDWEFVDKPELARRPATTVPRPQPFWATLRPELPSQCAGTRTDVLPVLLRSLRLPTCAEVFKGLVISGVRHKCAFVDFQRLQDSLGSSTEGGAPHIPWPCQ